MNHDVENYAKKQSSLQEYAHPNERSPFSSLVFLRIPRNRTATQTRWIFSRRKSMFSLSLNDWFKI